MRHGVARISLRPQLAGLLRLLHVSCHLQIIRSTDEELLPITDPFPQLISLTSALRRQVGLSDVIVHASQGRIGQGKLGVDLNGVLEQRYNSGGTRWGLNPPGGTVGFQSFERWCCRLSKRGIMLLHCRE